MDGRDTAGIWSFGTLMRCSIVRSPFLQSQIGLYLSPFMKERGASPYEAQMQLKADHIFHGSKKPLESLVGSLIRCLFTSFYLVCHWSSGGNPSQTLVLQAIKDFLDLIQNTGVLIWPSNIRRSSIGNSLFSWSQMSLRACLLIRIWTMTSILNS